jgi:hypothetical protein
VSEQRLREALLQAPVPDAPGAEERARRLLHAAYVSSPPMPGHRRRAGGRRTLQVAVAIGLIAALVSPAGAAVRHWVRDAVEPASEPALPALTSLPAPGALLVDSARGPWIVRDDGSKRLLGAYEQSTWSPHGLFVAASAANQLLVLDPMGEVRWTLARGGSVSDPAWSPDGYRVAYLNAGGLRVVGGDGVGDRRLERRVAPLAPAWRPGPHHVISFADGAGRIRTVDADTGVELFETRAGPQPSQLAWSRDGSRLLVVRPAELRLLDREGSLLWRRASPPGTAFGAAAFTSDASRVAAIVSAISRQRRSELLSLGPDGPTATLFAGPGRFSGVVPSPTGRWLVLAWQSADQWLFLDLEHPQRVVAVSGISAQFDPGTTSPPSFPAVAGWCCPAGD